jgi:carbon monoxide dehydrogenase subunit G
MVSNIANRHEITIEFEGRTVTGAYTVWGDVITVSSDMGTKATQVGGSRSRVALDWLAKRMLRELAQDAKARP